jgi:hypothetical protein
MPALKVPAYFQRRLSEAPPAIKLSYAYPVVSANHKL